MLEQVPSEPRFPPPSPPSSSLIDAGSQEADVSLPGWDQGAAQRGIPVAAAGGDLARSRLP